MDTGTQSLELHKKHKGKLEVQSKVALTSREDLSLAYTPGVAAVSTEIGKDKSLAKVYTLKGNTVAVVTDGSAILGLGNLGPEAALPVMEGKAALFKEFAGVDAFPICLDTQDTEEIIKTVKYLASTFGGINLEDISAPRCFEIERRLRAELDIPVMHDDQHGTAVVVLAGLINSLKLKDANKKSVKVVINGAGAAGLATANLLTKYGFENLIVCDSQGAIYEGRVGLEGEKQTFASITNKAKVTGSLDEVIEGADVFIGVSKAGLLTGEMVRKMNSQPVVFALANPTPEIMPIEAKAAGVYIMATGRSDFPNQVNNVLAFPGIFRGALDNGVVQLTDEMLIKAAEALASHVTSPNPENILPSVLDKTVAATVAANIK